MSIRFACESCRRVYDLPDESAGRQAKCECGEMLVVPAATTYTGRMRPHAPPETDGAPSPPSPAPPELPALAEPTEVAANEPPPLPAEAFDFTPSAPPEPAAPSLAEPASEMPTQSPAPPAIEAFSAEPRRGLIREQRHDRGLSFFEVLLAFFDPRLRSYLTPYLLRAMWCLTVIAATLFVTLSVFLVVFDVSLVELLLGRPAFPPTVRLTGANQPAGGLSEGMRELLGKLFRLGSLSYCFAMLLISARVLFELGIVVFNIADGVERIRARISRHES